MRKLGIGLSIIGLILVGIAFVGSAAGSNAMRCDLTGTVSGTVTDIAILPVFTGWNVNLSTANCRGETVIDNISDFFRSVSNSVSGYALIQAGGPYHIQVKVFDDNYKRVGTSPCYSFTTNVGEIVKSFSFPISFSNLKQGQNVIINTYNQCDSNSAGIQATFSKTV